jgi:hypothetical protein
MKKKSINQTRKIINLNDISCAASISKAPQIHNHILDTKKKKKYIYRYIYVLYRYTVYCKAS